MHVQAVQALVKETCATRPALATAKCVDVGTGISAVHVRTMLKVIQAAGSAPDFKKDLQHGRGIGAHIAAGNASKIVLYTLVSLASFQEMKHSRLYLDIRTSLALAHDARDP